MSVRELLLAVLLAVAGGCVVVGAATASVAAGWIVGGVALAGWSLVVLGDVS